MNPIEQATFLIQNPAELGRALGYVDFRDDLHGHWIYRMVKATEDMTLQAHRGSYKTTCLCVAIALLMVWQPEKNIIFLRKTDSDVGEVIKAVNRILNTDIVRELYEALTDEPLTVIRATSSEITLSSYAAPRGAAQLLGIGIGGSLTGKHADIIITDDIVNLKDRISRAERERTKAVYMELQNVRNPGGRIINTGTPWHKDDAFSLMPEPEKWDCYHTGMLDAAQLDLLRQSMAPSLFAANYELQHIAVEDALFTTAPTFTDDVTKLYDGIAQIDAAYGGGDYTAFTCGHRIGDKLYMYGQMWHGHVDTVLDTIIADCQRLRCAPVHMEQNADKGFVAKEIMRKGWKVRTYHEPENKYIKISTFLRKWWPNIIWLEGTSHDYINQIMDYTREAEHDDAPDSASVVCRYYDRRSGVKYVSPVFGG